MFRIYNTLPPDKFKSKFSYLVTYLLLLKYKLKRLIKNNYAKNLAWFDGFDDECFSNVSICAGSGQSGCGE